MKAFFKVFQCDDMYICEKKCICFLAIAKHLNHVKITIKQSDSLCGMYNSFSSDNQILRFSQNTYQQKHLFTLLSSKGPSFKISFTTVVAVTPFTSIFAYYLSISHLSI